MVKHCVQVEPARVSISNGQYVRMHGGHAAYAHACAAGVAQEQLDTGMAVFRRGQLTASLAYFEEASALMPLRSPVRSACQ